MTTLRSDFEFVALLTDIPTSQSLARLRPVYLVPDLILYYPELFSGKRVGVHEGVHSWEEVSLGRRGVEGAEEGGLSSSRKIGSVVLKR